MPTWSTDIENELTQLLKEWLKQQNRTQADLRRSLKAASTRMPALLEVLEHEHSQGGMPQVASRLCEIEAAWKEEENAAGPLMNSADPFNQLDLLLNEIRHDRSNEP